jgi:glycosyltransferase involved in cell wall biosynthesis
MKNILVLTSTFPKNLYDNVPLFVYDQISSIKKKYESINFLVLVPHYYDKKTYVNDLEINQIRYHYFWPFKFEKLVGRGILSTIKKNKLYFILIPFFIIAQLITTITYVKKFKPDLIYAHWFFPQALTALIVKKIFGVPYVFTTHAYDAIIMKRIPLFGKYIAKKIIENSNSYTSDSLNAETKLHSFFNNKIYNSEKSLVLPMPVKFRDNLKVSENVIKVTKKSNSKEKVLLYIGRFASKKGVNLLIEIFSHLNNEIGNTKLIIAGGGNELEKYKKKVTGLKLDEKVYFVGYVNSTEKKLLYDFSDLAVIPSIKTNLGDEEGLPVVVLESLNSNTITVASYQSNAAEVIINEVNGFLFNPENLDDSLKIFKKVTSLNELEVKNIIKSASISGGKYLSENTSELFYKHLFEDI